MTSRHPSRPGPRRQFKWLLGALLALIGVLAPVESPNLPPPLDDLAGVAAASAQTPPPSSTIDGSPDPCRTGWVLHSTDPSLCERLVTACAENPLDANTYSTPSLGAHLTPSVEFPDFCELTVLEATDVTMYQDCAALTGYVVKLTTGPAGLECRFIAPMRCPSDLNRTRVDRCQYLERRNWSCPGGALPRNQFNSCYRPPTAYLGPNPACQTGAPDLLIVSCEEYVGADYERGARACGSFATGNASTALKPHQANQYWCEWDASFLDVACHAAGATCAPSDAYCIKRASRTGGCDTVANTLRCRGLQADYRNPLLTVTATDVYRAGCEPCVVLPFESVPRECPPELRWSPNRPSPNHRHRVYFEAAHTYREDYLDSRASCVHNAHNNNTPMTQACIDRPRCADPPRGRIVWESTHHSKLAIVNSLIMLSIVDIPRHQGNAPRFGATGLNYALYTDWTPQFDFPDSGDPYLRTWRSADPSQSYGTVSGLVRGECVLRDWPDFRVRVEELWPDNDSQAILDLFGAGTLDWWTALTQTERKQHTEARGLDYVVGMTPADLRVELDRRASALNEEVLCQFGPRPDFDDETWCRWIPPRPGYYRLTAAAGWRLRVWGPREWLTPRLFGIQETFVRSISAGDGNCAYNDLRQRGHDTARGSDYDCVMDHLARMGATPQDIGLQHDSVNRVFTGLVPLPANRASEWLYSDAAGENYRCPPLDLRVACSSTAGAVNYTETEPVGIVVHEMRISTVVPSL